MGPQHRQFRMARVCGAPIAIFVLAVVLVGGVSGQRDDSMNAFLPAAHKTVFDTSSLFVLGSIDLAKSAVKGPVSVSGNADLNEFEFNADRPCNKHMRALTVAGRLQARMGSINNGYTVAGSGSKVQHNVRMSCTSRVEAYNPRKLMIESFEDQRESLIREHGDVCVSPPTGLVELSEDGTTLKFTPSNDTYSCYSVFRLETRDLETVTLDTLEYLGKDKTQNVVLLLIGKRLSMRNMKMVGFNPRRTLLSFCSVYGKVEIHNSRIQGAVLAPTTYFTFMDSVVNGSMVTADVRGKLAVLDQSYVTC